MARPTELFKRLVNGTSEPVVQGQPKERAQVPGGFFYVDSIEKIKPKDMPQHIMATPKEEKKFEDRITKVRTVGGKEIDNSQAVPLIKKGVWVGWQPL